MKRIVIVGLCAFLVAGPWSSRPARAEGAETSVSILALVVVVGIVAYVGWTIDKEDREQEINSRGIVRRADDLRHELCFASPGAHDGALDAGLAYRMTF